MALAVSTATWGCGSDNQGKEPQTAAGTGGSAGSSSGTGGSGGSAQGGTGQAGNDGSIAISPKTARAQFGGTIQFTASVAASDRSVTWSVREQNGGTISASGLYTAPSTSGAYHVVATRTADTSRSDTATITVSAPPGTPPTFVTGTWSVITPAELDTSANTSNGVVSVEVSASEPRTLYIAVDQQGVWKTTDGGSNWVQLNNPAGNVDDFHVGALDSPSILAIDPANPDHLYATEGVRGQRLGFWVTTDGGMNWRQPQGFVDLAASTTTNDVVTMVVHPLNFRHILLGSHSFWKDLGNGGIMESTDGGETWVARPPVSSWPGGTMGIAFLHDTNEEGDTWFVTTESNGSWRSEDFGAQWDQVAEWNGVHGGTDLYVSPTTRILYSGATGAPSRSEDNGRTWEQLQGGQLPTASFFTVWGDGEFIYACPAPYFGDPIPFFSAPESDPRNWTAINAETQKWTTGPFRMTYDPTHKILYSASWRDGVLALQVEDP